MAKKRYRLKLHVGVHEWLRYGEVYDGEAIPDARGSRPRVRLFSPGDAKQSCEVLATAVEEVT